MFLTFLNIYDAPHELSDEALNLRLSKYCTVFSARRGKFSNSHVYNGLRHYRVRVKEPLPSYLRFGKFLVRLSHDGQQHTCRRCNRAGHFANECHNVVCFNCDELGHESRDCEEDVRCCICKSTDHLARSCPFSWYKASSTSLAPVSSPLRARDSNRPDVNATESTRDHSEPPVAGHAPRNHDFLQEPVINSDVPLADVISPSPSSVLPSGESAGPDILDSQGFILEQIAGHLPEQSLAPNPPGPPSTSQDVDVMNPDLSEPVSDDQPSVNLSCDMDADVMSFDSPQLFSDDRPSIPLNDEPPDQHSSASSSVSSLSEKSVKNRPSVVSSRRKPAPLPPALGALSRRPTRPTLVTPRKPGSMDPPPPPPGVNVNDDELEDMDTHSSLKRKQELKRKKGGPKKGKH